MTKPKAVPEAAPNTAKREQRPAASPVDLGAFGAPKRGTTHWGLNRYLPDGTKERLYASSGTGIQVREWPLSELSEATIARLWGPGVYSIQWRGPSEGGGRKFLGWGQDFAVEGPDGSAPVASAATSVHAPPVGPSGDVFGMALRLNDQIAERASIAAQRDRDFLSAHTATTTQLLASFVAMGQQRQGEDGALGRLASVIERMDQRIAALEARRAPAEEDEDDEDEDEDDEDEGAAGKGVFKVGEPKGEQALVQGLNKLTDFLEGVTPAAAGVAAAWLAEQQEKMARRQAEQKAADAAKQLTNGVTTNETASA